MSEHSEPGGIVVSGGSVHIGAVAQGSHARASYKSLRPAEDPISSAQYACLADLMNDLLAAIQQHGTELPDGGDLQVTAAEISAELAQDAPDVPRIRRSLTRIVSIAGSILQIATAVTAVEQAIKGMS